MKTDRNRPGPPRPARATACAEYSFRQRFRVPAPWAFRWCIDFLPYDWKTGGVHGSRRVLWLAPRTVLLDDTFPAPGGRRLRKVKLVQIYPRARVLGEHPHRGAEPSLPVPIHRLPRGAQRLRPTLRRSRATVARVPAHSRRGASVGRAPSFGGRRPLDAVRCRDGRGVFSAVAPPEPLGGHRSYWITPSSTGSSRSRRPPR